MGDAARGTCVEGVRVPSRRRLVTNRDTVLVYLLMITSNSAYIIVHLSQTYFMIWLGLAKSIVIARGGQTPFRFAIPFHAWECASRNCGPGYSEHFVLGDEYKSPLLWFPGSSSRMNIRYWYAWAATSLKFGNTNDH